MQNSEYVGACALGWGLNRSGIVAGGSRKRLGPRYSMFRESIAAAAALAAVSGIVSPAVERGIRKVFDDDFGEVILLSAYLLFLVSTFLPVGVVASFVTLLPTVIRVA